MTKLVSAVSTDKCVGNYFGANDIIMLMYHEFSRTCPVAKCTWNIQTKRFHLRLINARHFQLENLKLVLTYSAAFGCLNEFY